ncbi:hypothetical protein GCM10009720_20030 [Yaniella flava]|uniref:HNH nuclease domain-containing protein n=1 Tax=Yaniella flava TaxID=287930 RepID=A0ABN2UMX7_9MICC
MSSAIPSSGSAIGSAPRASANLLAGALYADVYADETKTDPEYQSNHKPAFKSWEDVLPFHQQTSNVMHAAHESVDQQLGSILRSLNPAELEALQTQVTLCQQELLTTSDHSELFAPLDPSQHGFTDSQQTGNDHARAEDATPPAKLSLSEYAQIREENARLAETVNIRATADLVQHLCRSHGEVKIPGQSREKTPLAAATSYVASLLRATFSTVDKRITAAASLWPDMEYRRRKLKTPRVAEHLARGRIPFASATTADEKLSEIRQAYRRAGGDETAADDLVQEHEKNFVYHAGRNDPYTFSRYAKACSEAVTNALVGPKKPLTDDQMKHEKGLFYDGQVGDSLHKVTAIVDDEELLQLNAMREFATKLDSVTSTMRAQAHEEAKGTGKHPADGNEKSTEEVAGDSRITPEDIDYGIGQLFDGQTRAERWLHTLMDFLSSGLILHKTYDPHATDEEQRRRDTALQKAAEHSEVVADILGVDHEPPSAPELQHIEQQHSKNSSDPLAAYVPDGYQLLRPNLELIVEISLRDLIGRSPDSLPDPGDPSETDYTSELAKIAERLKHQERSLPTPHGSPGNVQIDFGLARQQACTQKIVPMVLGTASQPLDAGRAQRLFPPAIRRALHVRDRGCIVPGCPRPASWCEPHHLQPWSQDGPTSLANAGLVCRSHHKAVHQELIVLHMEQDGLPSCSLPTSQDPTQTRYRNIYWHA